MKTLRIVFAVEEAFKRRYFRITHLDYAMGTNWIILQTYEHQAFRQPTLYRCDCQFLIGNVGHFHWNFLPNLDTRHLRTYPTTFSRTLFEYFSKNWPYHKIKVYSMKDQQLTPIFDFSYYNTFVPIYGTKVQIPFVWTISEFLTF